MRFSLLRLTLIAWLAWLLTLAEMMCLSIARVLHPSFLYMAVPLGVQLICTVVMLFWGMWRMVRGPRRRSAAFWLWLGLMPSLWMAAYLQYLFDFASGRNHPPNLLVNMAAPVSSLIGEPVVRMNYPFRYEGERFVMWSDSPKQDEKQMAAMDAHIRGMEKSLAAKSDYKVYWVRGPVYGLLGRYVCGWSLASLADAPVDADGLSYVDRHEIAHFVLDQLLPRPDYTPMLLQEGWAEANSGPEHVEANRHYCWAMLHNRLFFSLRDLTSPAWYHNSDGPIYPQGGALVDYLLKRFGYGKFLALCRSCRQDTFPDDVERVLGVSLDELDDDYQEDLAKQETPEASDKEYLLSMKLGENVPPEKWRRFVDDYCAGVERLRTAFRQSSVKVTSTATVSDDTGKEITTIDVTQYDSDGQRQACTFSSTLDGFTNDYWLLVVTPELRYKLAKNTADKSCQLLEYKASRGRNRFSNPIENIDLREYLRMPLLPLSGRSRGSNFETKITEIEANSPLVRVHFENSIKSSGVILSRGWWDLDPERDYALVENQSENLNAQGVYDSGHVTVQYETIAGNPVLKTARSEYQTPCRKPQSRTIQLDFCQFGPPAAKIFELSTYGDFHPSDIKTATEPPPSQCIGRLTWIACGWTCFGILLICGSMGIRICRRKKSTQHQ
jgi:hypothetical protein